jgi:DNA-binding response OmpR family regulator
MALIIEDDPRIQLALVSATEQEGYLPLVAGSEMDGYCLLAEYFDRIGLLLLDIATEGVDAHAFRKLQLDAPRAAEIPTVMVSDHALTEDERKLLRPAAAVMKPLHLDAVRQVVGAYRQAPLAA